MVRSSSGKGGTNWQQFDGNPRTKLVLVDNPRHPIGALAVSVHLALECLAGSWGRSGLGEGNINMRRMIFDFRRMGISAGKVAHVPMSEQEKLEVVARLTDNVLAELTKAFLKVVKQERWGKRDLAQISGINETGIGHVLSGRRKNLTIETIALLARAMRTRPELVLHDLRPRGKRLKKIRRQGR